MRKGVRIGLSRGNQRRLFEIEGVSQKKIKVCGRQLFLQTVKSYRVSSIVKLWLIWNDSKHMGISNRMAQIFHSLLLRRVNVLVLSQGVSALGRLDFSSLRRKYHGKNPGGG
jgi:hypothetical protein